MKQGPKLFNGSLVGKVQLVFASHQTEAEVESSSFNTAGASQKAERKCN